MAGRIRALDRVCLLEADRDVIEPLEQAPGDLRIDVELDLTPGEGQLLLVVEHGHYTSGYGSHVIAEAVQAVPGIKAKKLAFPDVPGPGAAGMMGWLRPDAPKIVDAAVQMMRG